MTEAGGEYYASHLKRTQRSLGSRYSPLGRHHRNLNAFIATGLARVPTGGHLLDAGCGTSIWVTPEARQRYRILGIDIEEEAVVACRALYPGTEYLLGDLYALAFGDATFDAVVMREAIEHLVTPERAVREVHRILKQGGRFVVTTPNYDSLLLHAIEHTYNRFFGGPCKPYRDDVHPSKFTFHSLRRLVESYFGIERYITLDYGISLACVAFKL